MPSEAAVVRQCDEQRPVPVRGGRVPPADIAPVRHRERLTLADPFPGARSLARKRAHAAERARGRLPLPGVRLGEATGTADGVLGGMPAGAEPTARARAAPRSTAGDPHRAVRARRQSRRSARATRAGPESEEATVTERTAVFSPWCAWVRRASRPRQAAPGRWPGAAGQRRPPCYGRT